MILITCIILFIYMLCPLIGKIILVIVNSFIPDPLPYLDECVMWLGIILNIKRALNITDFILRHRIITIILIVLAIIGIYIVIK